MEKGEPYIKEMLNQTNGKMWYNIKYSLFGLDDASKPFLSIELTIKDESKLVHQRTVVSSILFCIWGRLISSCRELSTKGYLFCCPLYFTNSQAQFKYLYLKNSRGGQKKDTLLIRPSRLH